MELHLVREVMSTTGVSYYTAARYLSDNNWHYYKTVARIKSDYASEPHGSLGGYEASSTL